MSDMKMQAAVEMSVEQPVRALDQVGNAAEKMAGKVGAAADKAGASVDGVGAGASASADQLTRAEGRMVASIKRVQTQFELAGKTASQKFEFNIAAKGLDAAKFEPYLAQMRATEAAQARVATGAAEAAGKMAGLAAVAAGGAFAMWIKGAIDTADSLNDLSKSTSIAVETLSGLKLASKQSGAELEGTAQAINKLSVNMGANAAKFAAIGVTAKEPLEAFKQLADVFSKIDDPQMKAAFGAEALGKSWAAAAPLLAEGGQSIQNMVDKGILLSGVTQGLADDADAFNDVLEEWKAGLAGVASGIAGGLLPVMLAMSENMSAVTGKAEGMSGAFSPVTETLRAVAVVGGNVAYVLRAVGTEFGGMAAQVAAAAHGDFAGAKAIGQIMTSDAVAARIAFDKWESGVLSAGQAVAKTKEEVVALTAAQRASVKAFSESGTSAKKEKAPKEDFSALFLAQEQAAINAKALDAELKDIAKSNEDYAKSVASMLDPMEKEAYSLERQLETYGLTRSEIEATTIARLEEAKAMAAANGASADSIAFYEREIEARKRIASASASIDAKKATEDSAKKAASEWQKTSDKIGDSITDALMRGFESGKGFAETLRDTVVNMFKSMVLKPIIQATVISGMSALGMGAATAADSSSLGGLSNYASMGNSAYNYFTGDTGSLLEKGLSLFSSGAGTGAAGIAAGAGTAAYVGMEGAVAAGVAAGMEGAVGAGLTLSVGTGVGTAAAATAGMGAIGATGAGATVAAGGGVATAGATSMLAAVPVAGWIALAAIAAYSIFSSPAGGPKNKIQGWGSMSADGSVLLGDRSSSLADTGGPTARKYDFSLIAAVYTSAVTSAIMKFGEGYASSAKLSTTMDPEGTAKNKNVSQVARASGELVYNGGAKTGRGTADWAKWAAEETPRMQLALVADAMRTANDDYQAIAENFVGTSTNMTAAIKGLDSAAAATMMSTITSMATAFDSIAAHLNDSVTGQAVVNMSKFSGTIDALTANISSYYSAFFSEAEQIANTKASLTESFADMGMSLPANKAAFRAVAEGLDLTTVSGQAVFATMMSMSTAFAQVADAATASAKAASDAADAVKAKFLSMYETLTNALGAMTTSTGPTVSSRSYAQGSLDYVAESVKSGQSLLGFSDLITTAIEELSKSSDQLYSTFEDYATSQARAAASITYLQGNAYANSHADGLERVPYDGYQMTAHAGEAIVDAQSTAAIRRYFGGSGSNNSAMVDELKALREEVVNLRAETRAIAGHTNKSAKLLERAMPDGDALSTRVAA